MVRAGPRLSESLHCSFALLQLSGQPLSQPGPERNLQPPPLSQQPAPTQDSPEADLQSRLQLEQQPSDDQRWAKPDVLKRRRLLAPLLGFLLSAAFVGLIYCVMHSLQTEDYEAEKGRSPWQQPRRRMQNGRLALTPGFCFSCRVCLPSLPVGLRPPGPVPGPLHPPLRLLPVRMHV